jgi:hypothetical protein
MIKLEEIQILGKMLSIVHFEYRPVKFKNDENKAICRRESFPHVLPCISARHMVSSYEGTTKITYFYKNF